MPNDVYRPEVVWNEINDAVIKEAAKARGMTIRTVLVRAITAGHTVDSLRATRRINRPAARDVEKSRVGGNRRC
jgi:hypothetical protein